MNICRDIRNYPILFGLTKKDVYSIVLAEDTVRFTAISFFWQLIGFISLYLVSKSNHFPVLTSTGLYIPLILFIIGILIRLTSKILIKDKRNYEEIDKKVIILCGTVILSICMFFIDLKLALYIFAVILGKYIWIDFVFDYKALVDTIKKYKSQYFYFGYNSISIALNILSQYLFSFVMCTLALESVQGTPLWVRVSMMTIIYITMFGWAIAFHKDRVARFDYETEETIEENTRRF